MRAALPLLLLGCSGASPRPPEARPVAAQAAPPVVDLAACCRQCAGASQRDPSGLDIRLEPCVKYRGAYNGGPGVDDTCAALFLARRTRLGECQQLLQAAVSDPGG